MSEQLRAKEAEEADAQAPQDDTRHSGLHIESPDKARRNAPARPTVEMGAGDANESSSGGGGSGCNVVTRIWPHLSTENLPSIDRGLRVFWREMALEVIRCRVKLV